MLRSKEIQKQMRKKVIEIYQSGKGYKAISKALGTTVMIPKTFGKILFGLTRQKLNILEVVCPITSGIKVTPHFRKRTSYQQ